MTPAQREWHRQQCAQYRDQFNHYQDYAHALEQMLRAACKRYAPLAIVQARAKTFSSFAEKMARKAAKYMALGIGPTDLCGARVIAETQAEVERICRALRDAFTIDDQNSIDVRTRLKTEEFGYLSVHYVVQCRGETIFGVPVPPGIGDRKAEIQVRTLLEHAWASVSHDRIYKCKFQIPDHLRRELARVAALLEEADQQFGASVHALDTYKPYHGAHMTEQRLEEETSILSTVLDTEPDAGRKPGAALRLAELARARGDWHGVERTLAPYTGAAGDHRVELLAEHGHALCQLHRDRPAAPEFQQGRAEIEEAVTAVEGELRPRVLAYHAWVGARLPDNEEQARDRYRAAFEADPGNPFHLASYVEYEIWCGEPLGFRAVMRPVFEAAIRTCRAHADAGIELPWAFLTMGRFHLLMEQPYESLAAYAKAIRIWLSAAAASPETLLDGELAFIHRLHRARPIPETYALIRDLLLLAKAVRGGTAPAIPAKRTAFRRPVAILAGGAAPEAPADTGRVRDLLTQAFDGFAGTIVSGGTTAGIPGIAGEIAAKGAVVVGYLPAPASQADARYTELVKTSGADFGPREPLHYCTDLLAAGVSPADAPLIASGGGPIAAIEYRIALAFGAKVAILEPAGRAAAALCTDPDWNCDPNLLRVPADPMTVRALVNPPHPALAGEEIEIAARQIHENFLAGNRWKNPDPAMKPWDELRDDLKASNRMQAERAAGFLEAVGYRVRRAAGAIAMPALTGDDIELMAEMEHGRWVLERLQSGWRFDAKRDPHHKLSPYLVSWKDLPEDVKDYDRNAARSWPEILAGAGFEVVGPTSVP